MHERMESRADLYASDALSADERREAESHAASCASCASLLREASEFHRWITGTLAPDAPPSDLEERVVSLLRASSPVEPRRWRFLKGVGGFAAAAGLIFLGNAFTHSRAAFPLIALVDQATESHQIDYSVYPGKDQIDGPYKQPVYAEHRPYPATRFTNNTLTGSSVDEAIRKGVDHLATRQSLQSNVKIFGLSDGLTERAGADMKGKSVDTPPGKVMPAPENSKNDTGGEPVSRPKPPPWIPSADDKLPQVSTLSAAARPAEVFEERPPQENRKIVRNGEAALEVESYDAAYAKLAQMIAAEKGYISEGDVQKMPNGKVQANVIVRVPAERFEAVLGKLKDLGTVKYQNIKAEDVTKNYFDLQAKQKSKELLLERLKTILKEAKGTAKELMEVEVQIGSTQEAIDQIKGELRYYDTVVAMSTITIGLVEKDIGQPFEYVQTLESNIGLSTPSAHDVYAKAQKEITDAGGQIVDSKLTRQSDDTVTGMIKARIDAEKFPALRDALKKLGQVTNDTVYQQKTAHGGAEGTPKIDAPLKKQQAVLDLSITTPPLVITRRARVLIESNQVQRTYVDARKMAESAGGTILQGSLAGREDRPEASLTARINADKFQALVDQLKAAGKLKNAEVKLDLPPSPPGGPPPLLRERADIDLAIVPPPELIGEEHGIGRTIRDTFAGSWKAVLWSIEKLFVGLSLAGPWLASVIVGWLVWRRFRKKKAPAA